MKDMAKTKIGFRQLYLARGCGIAEDQELDHTFSVDGIEVKLYLGKRPKLNIVSQTKKIIPFDPTQKTPMSMGTISIQPVEKTEYNDGFFTDIFCTKEIDVPQISIDRLKSGGTELTVGKIEILEIAKKNHGKEFEIVANYIAGMIGLRYHFQLVFEVINEVYWLWLDDQKEWSVDSIHGPVMQILESITLNESGKQRIRELKFREDASVELMRSAGISLDLLKKAWQDHGPASKFINLFTSLEVAIKAKVSGKIESLNPIIEEIKDVIQSSLEGSEKGRLIGFLDSLTTKPKSLNSMFEELAREANFESHEDDLEAFKKFNINRNNLVHGGASDKLGTILLKNNKRIDFQDIVERYVNWVFFGDDQYYVTRYRERVALKKPDSST